MPSDISAIVTLTPVGKSWSVRYKDEDLASDLTLHDAKEAAERVAATLREHGFRFIRIKQERPKRGRWQR
jgi:hypothetical protein